MAEAYSVVTITGPRQSGKTTLVRYLFPQLPYFSFENPDIRFVVESDPRAFLNQLNDGAIFDEVQHIPQLLSYLQQIVDEEKNKLTFILIGNNQYPKKKRASTISLNLSLTPVFISPQIYFDV